MEEHNRFLHNKKSRKKNKNYKSNNEDNKQYPKMKIIIFIISLFLLLYLLIKIIIFFKKLNKKKSKNINAKVNNFFVLKEDDIEDIQTINKTQIHICMSLDNNLIYPTLVSMTSALENCDKNKIILVYYILLSYDFNISNLDIIESLRDKYPVKINYYKIPPRFNNLRSWTDKTTAIYYKLYIPFMFPNLKRYIFLDGDTLIYKDLNEMFNLDFNNSYVLGYPFHTAKQADISGVKIIKYINSGVMLVNNEKIINDKKDAELMDYTIKNCKKLSYPTQDPINIVFNNNIGFLPLKYGIYLIGSIEAFNKKVKKDMRVDINENELKEAINDPAIIHFSCCNPKIWNNVSYHDFGENSVCEKYKNEFYFYANKTNYYNEIYDLYIRNISNKNPDNKI